jgi:prepilin-type N-terminal cleavage/methylation domain-containing protein
LKRARKNQRGFTLVEMVVALGVFSIIALSILGLYTTMVSTTVIMKQKSIALSLATNQIEYVKSLPYSGLAVQGGSIYTTTPIATPVVKTQNNVKYSVVTSINYVDDAFDGCANYPNVATKNLYCRNLPSPTGSPVPDTNPQDYKIVNVKVLSTKGTKLAEVDTQISARVAETASTTGAMFVTVIDGSGNPVSGANVRVQNSTTAPATDLNDTTDSNGIAIYYGLTPDTSGFDYTLTASKSGYSTLNTIIASGSLQPNYPNLQVFTQQSSYATLTIKQQGSNSLLLETTDTAGAPLSGMKVYAKGGYKKYTLTTDTAYYYDNASPDTRPTTDASGLFGITNLVPGNYIFCGDLGATSCSRSGTTYYMVAAIPYAGSTSLGPITVPTQATAGDPATAYTLGTSSYLQKVRLMFSTSSNFPRVFSMTPENISLATTPLASFNFQLSGANLPCSSTAASCGTSVVLTKDAVNYTASCTGTSGTLISCNANLTGITAGMAQMKVTANAQTLTLPVTPLLGGLNVQP